MENNPYLNKILEKLVKEGEKLIHADEACSILVLDKDGLLRNGSSPKLPQDYLLAIDRLKPHPFVGTCAAAAATGNIVITPSFRSDDKWAELKHLPLSLGYTGAFSIPIKVGDRVLGTFGTYLKRMRVPTNEEIERFKPLCELASKALIDGAAAQS